MLASRVDAGERSLRAMPAVAAVNTTVAALPRTAAWCGDAVCGGRPPMNCCAPPW
ncbi:hypothetical protein [Streptomyces sp. URMC 126]|uniref:hypothetical protein n=1 Tax=Streptomyces sp. URMC 126 TaxID=3423401 RepID=UPI003F529523